MFRVSKIPYFVHESVTVSHVDLNGKRGKFKGRSLTCRECGGKTRLRNDEARSYNYFGNALTRAVTRKSRLPSPAPPRPYSGHLFRELQFKFFPRGVVRKGDGRRGAARRPRLALICHGTNSRILRILVHRTPATASRTCNPLRGP